MKKKVFKVFGANYIAIQKEITFSLILLLLFCYIFYSIFVHLPLFNVVIPMEFGEIYKYFMFFFITLNFSHFSLKSSFNLQHLYYVFPELIHTFAFYNLFVILSFTIFFIEAFAFNNIYTLALGSTVGLILSLYFIYKAFIKGQQKLVNRDFVYKRYLKKRQTRLIWVFHLYLAFIIYQYGYYNPYYWLRSY